jgi:serine/threonine-protein kinase
VGVSGETTLKIPNYVIEKKLGEGGMGAVYRARQTALNRTVAVKVLPERLSSNQSYVARLNREAMVLAKLHHPNIIMCYDMGEHQGNRYVVMEYVEGENLGSLIEKRGALPEKEALFYLKQAVIGMDHALAAGIIHRDIKPENMLLSTPGKEGTITKIQAGHTLKIADLGLATFTGESTENTRLTAEGSTLGSPHYMSPEQTVGESNLDFRTDIYALGITLYHMVTGNIPFQAATVGAVLAKKLSERIPDPRKEHSQLSPGLSLMIQRMTAKDRNDRYASYADLLRDIEALEQGRAPAVTLLPDDRAGMILLPETVQKLGATPRDGASQGPGKNLLIAAAAVAVIVIALVLPGLLTSKPVATPPPPAPVVSSSTKVETNTVASTGTGTGTAALNTRTASGTGTDTSATPPATFAPQYLVDEKIENFWKKGGEGDIFWNDEDAAICLQAMTAAWVRAEHALPASDYQLHVKMDTTTGADAAEVQLGIGKKEYIAIGIRLLKDDAAMTAYIERRESGTDKLIEAFDKRGGLKNKQEFFIRVSDRVVSCKLGKDFLGAPEIKDETVAPALRIATKKGIGRFFAIDVSPLTGGK